MVDLGRLKTEMLRSAILMAGAISMTTSLAAAQVSQPTRRDLIQRYLDASYVTLLGGFNFPGGYGRLGDLLVEADINQYLHVRTSERTFIKVNPRFRLRMFTEPSSPVRTPSFMPNATLFFGFGKADDAVPPRGFTYYSITLNHHSNGQSGDFYAPDGSINTASGSFSTNWLALAAYRVWATGPLSQAWAKLGILWHPGFNRDDELDDQYERVKLELATSSVRGFRRLAGLSLELRAYISYVVSGRTYNLLPDPGSGLPAERASVGDRVHVRLSLTAGRRRFSDLRIFLKYDHGFDYYNINFWRRLRRLQFGIAGDPF